MQDYCMSNYIVLKLLYFDNLYYSRIMTNYSGYVGYLRLEGPDIKDGILGARQSAEALLGFDSALRYLLPQVDSRLVGIQFELPVKIRKGSWEALIPDTVGEWLVNGGGLAATAYLTTSATQLAKNGFKDKDLTTAIKDSLRLLIGIIKIAKHAGGMARASVGKGVKFRDGNSIVEIPNKDKIYITTSRAELEAYLHAPKKLLEDIAHALNPERALSVGEVSIDGNIHEEKITYGQRGLFMEEDEKDFDDILFPELKHDQYVTLRGSMTRGNKITNTIGFQYMDHILTCSPAGAPITAFRESFFRNCIIHGHVSRLAENGQLSAKRPKIIFDRLIPTGNDDPQISLV